MSNFHTTALLSPQVAPKIFGGFKLPFVSKTKYFQRFIDGMNFCQLWRDTVKIERLITY